MEEIRGPLKKAGLAYMCLSFPLWIEGETVLLGKFSKSQGDSLEIVLKNDETMMANDCSDLDKGRSSE